MECDRILELLPGRLDGSLEEGGNAEVEAHLRDCPRCSAEEEALKETLALLRNLPPEKAPPELLEGVRRKIAAGTHRTATGRGLLASPRIRIPLEAAAVVLLFLLVYGIQRQIPVEQRPATPPARVETASPVAPVPRDRTPSVTARSSTGKMGPAERVAAEPHIPLPERSPSREPSPIRRERVETAADRAPIAGPGREASMETGGPTMGAPQAAKASFPAVPATRVSTGAEPVVPGDREAGRSEAPPPFRVFASPSSRLLLPNPDARELILEVAAELRPGLEDRIVQVVEGYGGSIWREWHFHGPRSGEGAGAPIPEGPMRIQIPADSADAFLSELRKLGTIFPEEIPARADLPSGPAASVAAYTVRIRTR